MPVKNTLIGELAVPARNATTNAKMTGSKPMSGSTVNCSPYQNAATPPKNEPMAKHDEVDRVRVDADDGGQLRVDPGGLDRSAERGVPQHAP